MSERDRRPHVAALEQEREARRHHADDRARFVVQPHHAPEHVGASAEAAAPERVADERHAAPRQLVAAHEAAAERGADA